MKIQSKRIAALFLAAAFSLLANSAPPNIVVFVADDAGMDFGFYGNAGIETPNLDRLAASGLVFDNAFLATSQCSPSRTSILTGQFPHTIGTEDLHTPLPEGVKILPSFLREGAGYFTGHMQKQHIGLEGYYQFDWRDREVESYNHARWNQRAPDYLRAFLDEAGERPFFLWVAFFDPHRPYGPEHPNPEAVAPQVNDPSRVRIPPYSVDAPESRVDTARYYDAISRMDRRIGEMLEILEDRGLREETAILFLSDNGAPLPREKATLYDSGIQTPLLLSWPGRVEPGGRYAGLTSAIDLAPTILDLAGVEPPESFYGESFLPVADDLDRPGRRYVFAERNWHGSEAHARAIRSERHKLIVNGHPYKLAPITGNYPRMAAWRELLRRSRRGALNGAQKQLFEFPRPMVELYDVAADPHETRNLAYELEHRELIRELIGELNQWREETGDHEVYERRELPDLLDRKTGIRLQRSMIHAKWPRPLQ